jgi:uncharacterized repeat protein (TIGR02543 family)
VVLGDDVPAPDLQTRTDWAFGGWFTQPNGEGLRVVPGEPLLVAMLSDQSLASPGLMPTTLYALWLYEGQYNVEFVLGGGNIGGDTINVINQVYIDDLLPVPATVQRTGWTLQGWNTQANGLGDWVSNATEVTEALLSQDTLDDPGTPTQFFAIWQANQYVVEFDLDDGTFEAITVTYGQNFTLPTALSRQGYDFDGWFTLAEGGTQITTGTQVHYSNIDPAVEYPGVAATFAAQFTPRNNTAFAVHVILENADGTFANPIVSNFSGTTGALVEAFDSFFTGANYVFDIGYTGNVLSANIAADGSTVLVLRYLRNTYTLTVELAGGTGVTGPSEALRWGEEFDLGSNPTKLGFTFDGWQIIGTGTNIDGFVVTMGTENATLTAQWDETPFYIELIADDDHYDYFGEVLLGAPIGDIPAADIGPNWHFVGWSQDDGESFLQSSDVLQSTDPFVAHFVRIYTIVFDSAGGTITDENAATVTRSATYTHNFAVPEATRPGYVFQQWVLVIDNQQHVITDAVQVWALTDQQPRNPAQISGAMQVFADEIEEEDSITIFAQWERAETSNWWRTLLRVLLGVVLFITAPLLMFIGGRLAGTLFCWYLENCA